MKHYKKLLFSILCILYSSIYGQQKSITIKSPYSFDISNFKKKKLNILKKLKGDNPNGDFIAVNNQHITKNGKPWIPITGEFHFSRYPEAFWEDAILKMKSSGLTAIASYVLWSYHEEFEGQWNWKGNRNLRKFVQLCAKHDMMVFLRIGPWAHAEARYGAHPDWLLKKNTPETLRSIHPNYLEPTRKLYTQIAAQIEGLYWKDGGPIFAIQLDNENWEHGEGKGEVLMEAEKRIALDLGIKVPIYTCTGWADAEFPQGEMIPTFGSYADYFWSEADTLYRGPSYSFSKIRADGQIGTDWGYENIENERYTENPNFTCETGTGMNVAYHRRTNLDAKDNGALSLVEIGNGTNLMGYFIFHGGRHAMDQSTRTNESLETGFNDNAVVSNDFQAAISEYGEVRNWYYEYLLQFGFINNFGEQLATMQPVIPDELDRNPESSKLLQRAIRTDGNSGFLFVSNHAANDTIYPFKNVQFDIQLKDKKISIPNTPIEVSKSAYFFWPFNMSLDNITLDYATAQPFGKISQNNTYIFSETDGIDTEYVFEGDLSEQISGNNIKITKNKNQTIVTTKGSFDSYFEINTPFQNTVRILTLTTYQAKHSYQQDDFIYVSDAEVLLFNSEKLEVISPKTKNNVWVYPPKPIIDQPSTLDGQFRKYAFNFRKVIPDFSFKKMKSYEKIAYKGRYVKGNPRVGVPEDSYFQKGEIISLDCPTYISENLHDLRFEIDYKASAGRCYVADQLVADNYYNGEKWVLSYNHLFKDVDNTAVTLHFIPLQKEDPIYINGNYWPNIAKQDYVLDTKSIQAIPVYKTSIKLR